MPKTRIALERNRRMIEIETPKQVSVGDKVIFQGQQWEVVIVYNQEHKRRENRHA